MPPVLITSLPPSPFLTDARSLPISLLCLPLISLTMSPSVPLLISIFPLHPMLPSPPPPTSVFRLPLTLAYSSALHLELILTHLFFPRPINRKSNESGRTWRFVQADRG
ncbi:hypothetical protein K443DRAFT_684919 [Laccaria amethystina LaAM-08-1]|uniref:Uncharacterized protein n=1 Tax=Laccaria amethystina LaAM-08-1 TaxID=1095629 RepID=A0A0C9WVY0_9AGAR|nr:hypothetical protein K443DRAFT_684919 [Laccaria amethystina LaAM-08-1]